MNFVKVFHGNRFAYIIFFLLFNLGLHDVFFFKCDSSQRQTKVEMKFFRETIWLYFIFFSCSFIAFDIFLSSWFWMWFFVVVLIKFCLNLISADDDGFCFNFFFEFICSYGCCLNIFLFVSTKVMTRVKYFVVRTKNRI